MRVLKCTCGNCKTCKGRESWRRRKGKAAKRASGVIYPIAQVVTIWECSDGREFSSEVEACRYELELFRKG